MEKTEQERIAFAYWKEKAYLLPQHTLGWLNSLRTEQLNRQEMNIEPAIVARIADMCNRDSNLLFAFYATAINLLMIRCGKGEYSHIVAGGFLSDSVLQPEPRVYSFNDIGTDATFKNAFQNFCEELVRTENQCIVSNPNLTEKGLSDNCVTLNLIGATNDIIVKNSILSFHISPAGEIRMEGAVPDSVARQLMHNLQFALAQFTSSPYAPLGNLELVGTDDFRDLEVLNAQDLGYRSDLEGKTVVDLFRERAVASPGSVALRAGASELSYGELDKRSEQLGSYLLAEKNIKGKLVGIFMERSIDMVVSFLGILKAGATMVPLDMDNPEARNRGICEQSGMSLLITSMELMLTVPGIYQGDLVVLDLLDPLGDVTADGETVHVREDTVAYVLYTSGSAGAPKGVAVTHGSLANYLAWANSYYFENQGGYTFSFFTAVSFDLTVTSLWSTLLRGDTVEIYGSASVEESLRDMFEGNVVDTVKLTPSHIRLLLGLDIKSSRVRKVIVGGEAFGSSEAEFLFSLNRTMQVYNEYGPTEATVGCTVQQVRGGEPVTIGRPMAGNWIYLVDEALRLEPMGVYGEVLIGGYGVAKGYHSDPAQTAGRFLEISSGPLSGMRLYRTGDKARWLPNGELEYAGRLDRQVKVRGNRVELGEIENALLQIEDIREAVVVFEAGQLTGYYVSPEAIADILISGQLSAVLPSYMVPYRFVWLEAFPVNSRGKLDYSRLPKAEPEQAGYRAAESDKEKLLVQIWEQVLRKTAIGIDDNFFALGGDSIRIITLINAINRQIGSQLEVKDVFEYQTISALSTQLSKQSQYGSKRQEVLDDFEKLKKHEVEKQRTAGIDISLWEDLYPLSDIEFGMLLHSSMSEEMYIDQFFYQFSDDQFDFNIFREAIELMVEKHDILRARYFVSDYSSSFKVVYKSLSDNKVDYRDLSGMTKEEQVSAVSATMEHDRKVYFKGNDIGLWHITMFRVDMTEFGMLFGFHHAIIDGWSRAVFVAELTSLYNEIKRGKSLAPTFLRSNYKDYVIDQKIAVATEEIRDFWRDQLIDAPGLVLPFRISKVRTKKKHTARVRFPVNKESSDKLQTLSRQLGSSVRDICFAAFLYVIHRTANTSDFLTGLVTHGRPPVDDAEKVIGCFLNTVPFRMDISNSDTVKDFINNVRSHSEAVKKHDRLSLIEINKLCNRGEQPLFDILFSYVDFHVLNDVKEVKSLMPMVDYYENTNTNLDFGVGFTNGDLGYSIAYNPDMFSKEEANRLASCYEKTLAQFTSSPYAPLGNLELVGTDDFRDLEVLNAQDLGYRSDLEGKTVVDLFRERAVASPGSVALRAGASELSYGELDKRSEQLGSYLLAEKNIKGKLVGIFMERSIDMVVSFLGILKAGATMVPLDMDNPEARNRGICEQSGMSLLITSMELMLTVPGIYQGDLVVLDLLDPLGDVTADGETVHVREDTVAYVLYTSGSAGAPKGVAVTHGSLANYLAWANSYYFENQGGYTFSFFTAVSFDLTVTSLWSTLLRGDTVEIYGSASVEESLRDMFEGNVVDTVKLTPSHIRLLLGLDIKSSRVRKVIVGGEAFGSSEAEFLFSLNRTMQVYNEYGPTEATVGCTVQQVRGGEPVTIGRPMAGNWIYLVDEALRLEPMGVYGEVLIGGYGVAKGYHSDPAQTAGRFLEISSGPLSGMRLYRTGDKARWLPNGELEYAGRLDRQVKVRGNRVELGEIENALLQIEDIREAVVVFEAGQLTGYYVSPEAIADILISGQLSAVLPSYMVPYRFVWLEAFPVNSRGKLDYSRLPKAEPEQAGYRAAESDKEKLLVQIWEQVLRKTAIGIDDNFFALGGDSIKAIQMCSSLLAHDYKLTVTDIFEAEDIHHIAQRLRKNNSTAQQGVITGDVPLTPIQRRFFKLNDANPAHFNQSVLLKINDHIDNGRLAVHFSSLAQHHDMLRSSYRLDEQSITQTIHANVPVVVEDAGKLSSWTDPGMAELIDKLNTSFQLGEAPLFRLATFRLTTERYFLIVMHHLIVDVVSWGILLSDLDSMLSGTAQPLPPKTNSYRDWSEALSLRDVQMQVLNQERLFERQSDDYVADQETLDISIDSEVLKNIEGNVNEGTQDVLLAAIAFVLHETFAQESFSIAVESHGRDDIDAEIDVTRTVGWFTTIFPISFDFSETYSAEHITKHCRAAFRNSAKSAPAYMNTMYPAMKVASNLKEPVVAFNYLGRLQSQGYTSFQPVSSNIGKLIDDRERREFPLYITGAEVDGRLLIQMNYNKNHFKKLFTTRLLSDIAMHFTRLVSALGNDRQSEGFGLLDEELSFDDLDAINSQL